MSLASVDGAIMPAEQATIPATDEGLVRGDGVFEVLRIYGGRLNAFDQHLERLELSARNLRLELDARAVRSESEALVGEAGDVDALLRIMVTRGGCRLAFIEPLPSLPEQARLATVTYAPTRVLDGVKSLSYGANMLCTRLAKERGFDDALLVSPHGRVLEAPTSAFFWVSDGQLRTAPLDDHVLDSITRRRVVASGDVAEESYTLDDLRRADEAFLASTIREVQAVSAVDEIEIPAGGRVTAAAAQALRERIEAELGAARV